MKYDSPGRPSILHTYPDLHKYIHNCIEFEKTHKKWRREVIKVRTVHHLHSALEEKYNEYLVRTTLNTYLLPRNFSSLTAKAHHHLTLVAMAGISRIEKKYILMSTIVLLLLKEQNNLLHYFLSILSLFHKMIKQKSLLVFLLLVEHFK